MNKRLMMDGDSKGVSLRAELRSWLRPERRWHYVFHLFTMLVASAYWLFSLYLARGDKRTFAETILYRPEGDSQLWPIISAMSQFNFGDPTDAIKHGQGTTSATVLSLSPYVLACAVFGNAGYVVADILCVSAYFAAIYLFLRVCGVGRFTSLLIGSALASGVLQVIAGGFAKVFVMGIDLLGLETGENHFPNLLELKIYGTRVQRPVVTEIGVVFLMACLVALWQNPARATLRFGACLGALMGAVVQGELFALGVLGLTFAVVLLQVARSRGWKPTAWLLLGAALGAAAILWHFVYQRMVEHPDIPRRLGLNQYDRFTLMFLPGYAPLVRVGVVAAMAALVCYLARARRPAGVEGPAAGWFSDPTARLAVFFAWLLVAAYLAQPVQILLLSRGAQIYHYLHIVPVFYSYAMLVLLFHLARLASPPQVSELIHRLGSAPGRAGVAFGTILLGCGLLLAVEGPIRRIYHRGTVCNASVVYQPWGKFGDEYRPNFTRMNLGLINNPAFAQVRTFATFNQDVYVLLTAFYGKRAFVPDAALTVLSDAEIEDRLCIMAKIFNLSLEGFLHFIQRENIKNFFLGSNKYRFASDYRFSQDPDDYLPSMMAELETHKQIRQWGWILTIPKSELIRIVRRYVELKSQPSDLPGYPDLIILDHNEVASGLEPVPEFYRLAGTNDVFRVYSKIRQRDRNPRRRGRKTRGSDDRTHPLPDESLMREAA